MKRKIFPKKGFSFILGFMIVFSYMPMINAYADGGTYPLKQVTLNQFTINRSPANATKDRFSDLSFTGYPGGELHVLCLDPTVGLPANANNLKYEEADLATYKPAMPADCVDEAALGINYFDTESEISDKAQLVAYKQVWVWRVLSKHGWHAGNSHAQGAYGYDAAVLGNGSGVVTPSAEEQNAIFAKAEKYYQDNKSDYYGTVKIFEKAATPKNTQVVGYFSVVKKTPAPKPTVSTTATFDGDAKEATASHNMTVNDKVSMTGLDTTKEYTVKGVLMDKATNAPLKDAEGKPIAAETSFKPDKADAEKTIEFKFDGYAHAGKDVVVFETLYKKAPLTKRSRTTNRSTMRDRP